MKTSFYLFELFVPFSILLLGLLYYLLGRGVLPQAQKQSPSGKLKVVQAGTTFSLPEHKGLLSERLSIGQVTMKSHLPKLKIYLSLTTEEGFC